MTDVDITQPFSPPANHRIGSALVIFGILLLALLPYSLLKKKHFSDGAAIVTGRIIKNEGAPEISFQVKTGELISVTFTGFRSDLKKDDEVEVVYSLDNPENLELKTHLWFRELAIGISGIILISVGWLTRMGLLVWGPLKQSRVKIGLRL
jgi:hypothetical protein